MIHETASGSSYLKGKILNNFEEMGGVVLLVLVVYFSYQRLLNEIVTLLTA